MAGHEGRATLQDDLVAPVAAPPKQGNGTAQAKAAQDARVGGNGEDEKHDIEATFRSLDADKGGLASDEAGQRQQKYGRNELAVQEASRWQKLLGYFWGPIPWMIEAAAVISLARLDWADFAVIAALLLYNAAVGFWQDNKAANALAALKKGLALKAQIHRDGKWQEIDAVDLVPGDVIRIGAGEVIPADAVLFDGQYLSVDQSALTGESLPVSHTAGDLAYSGAIARQGTMDAVVTAIGAKTFFGKTAALVAKAGSKSHAERAVLQIGDFLILLALALAVVLIGTEVYRDLTGPKPWVWSDVGEIAQFVLVLLVASVPVAMPAVMTVTMALGALHLSREKAIVSRLSSIEELAGVDVLCSDKTGTLTQNKLSIADVVTEGRTGRDEVLLDAALASQPDSHDPIDDTVFGALGEEPKQRLDSFRRTNFTPFDPVNKKAVGMATDESGAAIQAAKGAPQVILDLCGLAGDDLAAWQKRVGQMARKGFRALGVARSEDGGKTWRFRGLLAMMDPPRTDAKETISRARDLGLQVKMVTGDDVAIGRQIAGDLGLGANLLAANDVFGAAEAADGQSRKMDEAVDRADGFARVFPEHKFAIVEALQRRDHIVAMTGDGVNDAPALKQADCGVAVSGATDAARTAAALILTAPGLATIVNAIIQSREIFQRISSYVYYRIAMTLDIMVFVVLASVVMGLRPLTAIMIVALALLDDIPIMTIAYDNCAVAKRPIRWDMHHVLKFSSLMGLVAFAESFALLLIADYWMAHPGASWFGHIDLPHLQTMMFLELAAGGHLLLFVVRTPQSIFRPPYPSKPLFLAIVGTQILAVLMCAFGVLVPQLPWSLIGFVWIYVLVWMVATDLVKLLYQRQQGGHGTPVKSFLAREIREIGAEIDAKFRHRHG